MGDLEYAQDRGYFSNKSSKTLLCHVIIFLTQNCFVIIPVMIAVLIVSLWYFKRNRKRNRMLRRKQIAQDRKEDVLEILKNYMDHSNQRWFPIIPIRFQIMGECKNRESEKEWRELKNWLTEMQMFKNQRKLLTDCRNYVGNCRILRSLVNFYFWFIIVIIRCTLILCVVTSLLLCADILYSLYLFSIYHCLVCSCRSRTEIK